MTRTLVLSLGLAVGLLACAEDAATGGDATAGAAAPAGVPAADAPADDPDAPATLTASSRDALAFAPPADGEAAKRAAGGFDYLTDCDSLVVDAVALGPGPSAMRLYARGTCATNKSYEVLLVPKAEGAQMVNEKSAPAVFVQAAKDSYRKHIAYAMLFPKLVRADMSTGETTVIDVLPANVRVMRLDGDRWNPLGADRADDVDGLNALRYKIVDDQALQYQ